MTFEEIVSNMAKKAERANLGTLNGIFQFLVHGEGGGKCHAVVRNGVCRVQQGGAEKPDVIVAAQFEHVSRMLQGRMNPMLAFLTGKIKVSGDVRLISQAQSLLTSLI